MTKRPLNRTMTALLQQNPDFFQPPREAKFALKNRVVREVGGNYYSVRLNEGKRLFARVIGSFQKGFDKSIFHCNVIHVQVKTSKRLQ